MISEQQLLTNEAFFIQAYRSSFPGVAAFVKKMGGSFEEARDVFQDALVIYYEKKKADPLTGERNEAQYLFGISRHLWYRKYHAKKNHRSLTLLGDLPEDTGDPGVSDRLLRFVERSGKKCLELLQAFYYDALTMKEISERFGFSGERSATTQKFKCLEKVRNAIKTRSLLKEDFYD